MYPDPKWLDLLKLPPKVTFAVTIASVALLVFELNGVLQFGPAQPLVRPILIIFAVVFGALSVVTLLEPLMAPLNERHRQSLFAMRRAFRNAEAEERRARHEAAVLARLDTLSAEEISYITDCLRKGTPSFYTYIYSPAVTLMQGKSILWTPGGTHHQDHHPFSFFDFVWKALVERKEEFFAKDAENATASEDRKRAERRGWT